MSKEIKRLYPIVRIDDDDLSIEEFYKPKNRDRITIERLRGNDYYLIEYQLRIRREKQTRKFRPYD